MCSPSVWCLTAQSQPLIEQHDNLYISITRCVAVAAKPQKGAAAQDQMQGGVCFRPGKQECDFLMQHMEMSLLVCSLVISGYWLVDVPRLLSGVKGGGLAGGVAVERRRSRVKSVLLDTA